MGEYTDLLKNETLRNKDNIVLSATSESDCYDCLCNKVDEIASNIVSEDDFLKSTPVNETNKVKKSLKMKFEKSYVRVCKTRVLNLFFLCIFELQQYVTSVFFNELYVRVTFRLC